MDGEGTDRAERRGTADCGASGDGQGGHGEHLEGSFAGPGGHRGRADGSSSTGVIDGSGEGNNR